MEIDKIWNEKEITDRWDDSGIVKLSIVCTTFNHEEYIEQAILGFLSQITSYRFEVIIHDDASDDNTVNIIERYKKSHPNLIRVLKQDENQYSKGYFRPFLYSSDYAVGEYIAFCEGDDFWLDPYKIDKQVSHLDKYPNFILSHSNACSLSQSNVITHNINGKYNYDKNFDLFNSILSHSYIIRTASVVVRTELLKSAFKNNMLFQTDIKLGDLIIWLDLSDKGGFFYHDEEMVCYRVLLESASHSSNVIKKLSFQSDIFFVEGWFFLKRKSFTIFKYVSIRLLWLIKQNLINLTTVSIKRLIRHSIDIKNIKKKRII
ncbi:glycosyltransferase [Vibrio coralliirubri]|uniref:glycosyltransferase n=1 Tax=Vibrio coralliirubri TaxID=1516159 RepID=UPI002FE09AAB